MSSSSPIILPVPGRNVSGTLLLLLNAKKGREIAKVGINDSKNATKRAVVADKGCATNLFVFELDDAEDDGNEDNEDGTMKNLSAFDKAPGRGRIVPEFDIPDCSFEFDPVLVFGDGDDVDVV